jgi:hypothetical protein
MSSVMVAIRLALRAWPLTAFNYAVVLLLGLVGALPFFSLWRNALDTRPHGDALLEGLQLVLVKDIGQYDRNSAFGVVMAALFGVLLAGWLVGALVAGGSFEVLLTARGDQPDPRPFFHRFFRGAGRFFGRYVRLMVLNTVVGVIVAGSVLAAVSAALSPLGDSVSAWQAALPLLAPLLLAALLWLFFFVAQEYARVVLVVEDGRSAFVAWARGLWFVLRSPATTLLAWAVPGLAGLAVMLGVASATWASPVGAWGTILTVMLAQQLSMLFRSWTRVVVAGAALDVGLTRGLTRRPVPAPPEVAVTPVGVAPAQGPADVPLVAVPPDTPPADEARDELERSGEP